ncbi:hypothetical protein ACXR0O_25100 [Verrucomicrobiota bacterium sgz303538]
MSVPVPDPDEIPAKNWKARFVIGFLFGAFVGFLGGLRDQGHLLPALFPSICVGLAVGVTGALFGKRVFDFLIAFLIRFP